jgi:hypothetical protein
MQIYLYQNNKQEGPYTDEDIRRLVKSGAISQTVSARHESHSEWQPLNTLITFPANRPAFPPPPKQNKNTETIHYYYQHTQGEAGPFTTDGLFALVRDGSIPSNVMVRKDNSTLWQAFDRVFSVPPSEVLQSSVSTSAGRKSNEIIKNNDDDDDTIITHEAQQVIYRYRNAYRVAKGLDSIGNLAMGVAALVFVGGVAFAVFGPDSPFRWGVVVAAAIFMFMLYVIGTLVSALGQGVEAQLDTAVHTSPFLSEGQKAIAMGL